MMTILIPAYEPDHELVDLVRELHELAHTTPDVVVVDDGSGPRYAHLFAAVRAAGAEVITHDANRGKGHALKSGFAHIRATRPGAGVVCADSDGQHRAADILRVEAAIRPGSVVLGARQFAGCIPLRSRIGNDASRVMFAMATGLWLRDTQTGLRAYPADLLDWLGTVPGDRYEYEMDLLLAARRAGLPIIEVPIQTVYLGGNESSHFRPLLDSARVYLPMLRFAMSSLAAFAIDTALLLVLMAVTGNLLVSVAGARLLSAAANFAINRGLVFRGSGAPARLGPAARRYAALAGLLLAANYAMLDVLTAGMGVPLLPAKIVTEATLFVVSYLVQRHHVFGQPATSTPRPHIPDVPTPGPLASASQNST